MIIPLYEGQHQLDMKKKVTNTICCSSRNISDGGPLQSTVLRACKSESDLHTGIIQRDFWQCELG